MLQEQNKANLFNAQDHLTLWKKWRSPPEDSLRQIKGGRLTGFTDINPIWRYKVLTEEFGPCGIGWKYTVDKLWDMSVRDEIVVFSQVSLYYFKKDHWSDAVQGIGGSKLATKESGGIYVWDDCYKASVTDALSVCCKVLGIGADVYWNDQTKYNNERERQELFRSFVEKHPEVTNEMINEAKSEFVMKGFAKNTPSNQWDQSQFNSFMNFISQKFK